MQAYRPLSTEQKAASPDRVLLEDKLRGDDLELVCRWLYPEMKKEDPCPETSLAELGKACEQAGGVMIYFRNICKVSPPDDRTWNAISRAAQLFLPQASCDSIKKGLLGSERELLLFAVRYEHGVAANFKTSTGRNLFHLWIEMHGVLPDKDKIQKCLSVFVKLKRRYPKMLDKPDNQGLTPLMAACLSPPVMVRALLLEGAHFYPKDIQGAIMDGVEARVAKVSDQKSLLNLVCFLVLILHHSDCYPENQLSSADQEKAKALLRQKIMQLDESGREERLAKQLSPDEIQFLQRYNLVQLVFPFKPNLNYEEKIHATAWQYLQGSGDRVEEFELTLYVLNCLFGSHTEYVKALAKEIYDFIELELELEQEQEQPNSRCRFIINRLVEFFIWVANPRNKHVILKDIPCLLSHVNVNNLQLLQRIFKGSSDNANLYAAAREALDTLCDRKANPTLVAESDRQAEIAVLLRVATLRSRDIEPLKIPTIFDAFVKAELESRAERFPIPDNFLGRVCAFKEEAKKDMPLMKQFTSIPQAKTWADKIAYMCMLKTLHVVAVGLIEKDEKKQSLSREENEKNSQTAVVALLTGFVALLSINTNESADDYRAKKSVCTFFIKHLVAAKLDDKEMHSLLMFNGTLGRLAEKVINLFRCGQPEIFARLKVDKIVSDEFKKSAFHKALCSRVVRLKSAANSTDRLASSSSFSAAKRFGK